MSNYAEVLRALPVGESHAIMRRVPVGKFKHDAVQQALRKLNNNVGAIANRVGGFTVERIVTLNTSNTHVLYGLVLTRESAS